jgi:putative transposase
MQFTDPITGKTFFAKRRRRYDGDLSPRELTFSCYRRYPFLSKDQSRTWFIEALEEFRSKWPIDVWAYVIMPEHVHLLLAPREEGVAVGRFVGRIKEKVARRGIAWLEQHATKWLDRITLQEGQITRRRFWQPGGGYDRKVDQLKTLQAMIDYIHANPVRRGLVERPEDWEWSSARFYAGIDSVKLQMDRTLPIFLE